MPFGEGIPGGHFFDALPIRIPRGFRAVAFLQSAPQGRMLRRGAWEEGRAEGTSKSDRKLHGMLDRRERQC